MNPTTKPLKRTIIRHNASIVDDFNTKYYASAAKIPYLCGTLATKALSGKIWLLATT